MDKVFLDTNVVLDVLEKRRPHFPASLACLSHARSGACEAAITALSLSDIAYISRKKDWKVLLRAFSRFRTFLAVAPIDAVCVDGALNRKWPDFEDGLQWNAACRWGATVFLTRNQSDFPSDHELPVLTPSQYLQRTA